MSPAAGWIPSTGVILEPVVLQLRRRPGPLLPQVEAALAVHGEPLRWAITAVVPATGAAQLADGHPDPDPPGAELRLEAIVCRPAPASSCP